MKMSTLVIPVTYNNPGYISSPLNTGTSIVACEFQSGVVIGTDSRRTTGDYINNRNADKIIQIDEFIYCSGSGPVAGIQSIIDSAKYQLNVLKNNSCRASVLTVAAVFREICYCNRNFLNAEFIIVGCDDTKGGQIYVISAGGVIKREPVSALGSGSSYVYGYIDANFEANMTKKHAEAFVSKTLALAVARDCSSGGQLSLVVITKDSMERFIVDS